MSQVVSNPAIFFVEKFEPLLQFDQIGKYPSLIMFKENAIAPQIILWLLYKFLRIT